MSDVETDPLKALEAGAWRVWNAGCGPLPAAYASWCYGEVRLATAALWQDCEANAKRAEAACDERDRLALRLAGALLAADGGDGCPPGAIDAIRECPTIKAVAALRKRAEKAEAEVAAIKQAISDPENQPSQFGTVPVALLQSANRRADSAEDEVSRLKGLLEKRPEPYTPRVGDSFSWDGRHFIFAGPAAPAGPYVPRVGDVVLFDGEDAESAEKLPRIVTAVEPDGWWSCVHINKRGGVASGPFRLNSRISPPRLYRASTPAERAAAGLEPVDAGLVGQHGELLKAAVAKEAPAQPQVIPGSLRGFPWDADWDKVIDGDAVIYGGRKITFRVEPFSADPHPAPVQPQQPQVLKEHLAWIEADAELTAITFHDKYDFEASLAAKDRAVAASIALRAAVARRDGGAK